MATIAGCGDAVLLTVTGDRAVPAELDAICLAVADRDPAGGAFGRMYRLEGDLGRLPQTLAVQPGGASSAEAWVRGFRGGVEVAADRAGVDFGGDVSLRLDRCAPGGSAAPVAADPVGPGDARLAVSMGRGGARVVAVGAGGAAWIDADGGALVATDLALPAGRGVIAFDADGDCDDDVLVWTDAEVRLFHRGVTDLDDGEVIASEAIRAAAAADVDRDGDVDLLLGGGATLRLYRNDGGHFTADATAIPGGAASDVTALALGDLDGDGNPDVVVGQGDAAGAPPRALLADASGQGVFALAPAILPDVALQVRDLALADVDGDGDLDLGVALAGAPVRLYVNRGGRLEDQSFVRLPQPAPEGASLAIADWTGDCKPDLAVAVPAGSVLWRGEQVGTTDAFTADAAAAGASAVRYLDLDDDGRRDLVLATPGGVTWLRR
ncbi:MAG: VCBS repeat-containing protein [Kofleriaceae bacterium]|nr:VCBS repeat-containing protein [Kofleriaceae bacterium]